MDCVDLCYAEGMPALPTQSACCFIEVPEADSRLWLRWNTDGLTHIDWCAPGSSAPEHGAVLPERALPYAFEALARYLAGDPDAEPAKLPYSVSGTPFQQRVWSALRSIPRGEVRSYGSIAKALDAPRAMRAVGGANGSNPVPIVVPCHRVVETGFRLGGYSGGLDRKRFLLHLEGVEIHQGKVKPGQLELI